MQPGKQQQHRFSVSLPSLCPAQEVPGIGEALARDRGNGVCIPHQALAGWYPLVSCSSHKKHNVELAGENVESKATVAICQVFRYLTFVTSEMAGCQC